MYRVVDHDYSWSPQRGNARIDLDSVSDSNCGVCRGWLGIWECGRFGCPAERGNELQGKVRKAATKAKKYGLIDGIVRLLSFLFNPLVFENA